MIDPRDRTRRLLAVASVYAPASLFLWLLHRLAAEKRILAGVVAAGLCMGLVLGALAWSSQRNALSPRAARDIQWSSISVVVCLWIIANNLADGLATGRDFGTGIITGALGMVAIVMLYRIAALLSR